MFVCLLVNSAKRPLAALARDAASLLSKGGNGNNTRYTIQVCGSSL